MANQKPILKIDKFSGIGENGILYCNGLYPEIANNKSLMSEGYTNSTVFNIDTTGFTNIGTISDGVSLTTMGNSDNHYDLYLESNILWAYQVLHTNIANGKVHYFNTYATTYPSILETNIGNIFYSSSDNIGRGLRGAVSSGSTTTIVDTTKDFVGEGIAVGDKVTNLTTGIEYTITVVATTTLTFVADGTNTNSLNDEYIVWSDTKYTTTITKQVWQPNEYQWTKQILAYGSQYMFTNGNYLGMISADETTVDATYKQLPDKHQALCFSINNNKILVSSNHNGNGVLLLWDGFSNGWNNILNVNTPVTSLVAYKSGWLLILNGILYYTDGYQIQKLYSANMSRATATGITPTQFNSLAIYKNNLFIANFSVDNNFLEKGVYAIDLLNLKAGFTLIKNKKTVRYNSSPFGLFISHRFTGSESIYVCGDRAVNSINSGGGYAYENKSLLVYISLPKPVRITSVGLNLARDIKSYNYDYGSASTREVQVAIGDGKRGLISYMQSKSTGFTPTSMNVDETAWLNNKVGDELYFRDTSYNFYGERTFITDITNAGTATAIYTLSPPLSGTNANYSTFKVIKVKKLDRITLNNDSFNEEIMFDNPNFGFLSDKLFLEIVFYGNSNPMPISISEIKIYGD